MKKHYMGASIFLLAIVLTACAQGSRKLKVTQCPAIYVAATTEEWRSIETPESPAYIASIQNPTLRCVQDRSTKRFSSMMTFRIALQKLTDGALPSQIRTPVLMFLLDPKGDIVERVDARVTLFPASSTSIDENGLLRFEQTLGPLAFGGAGGRLDSYHYLLGFQLTPAQAQATKDARAKRLISP